MSAQTGTSSIAPPPSSRGVDRVREQVNYWWQSPNPIWVREMRQSARLTRTPFILMTVAAFSALLLCTIGGVMSSMSDPATIGIVLHHTFFSIAFFVVTVAGPTLAANSISSEREGRTWEALQLTGLSPGVIARGKFTSAFTNIAMYVVMMAPVGALPFLFGGVTAIEVVLAFVWLFIIAGLSVAAGLALSSKMDSMRGAIVVTLLLTVCLLPFGYSILGFGGSAMAHEIWREIPQGYPVWLPTAYERAPLGLEYLGLLVALPLLSSFLPAWFFYEVTIANLSSPADDRSTGIRRCAAVSAALLVTISAFLIIATQPSDRAKAALVLISLYSMFVLFFVFVFAGEPIGPSRRVNLIWQRTGASAMTRFFGPGVIRASSLSLLMGVGGLGGLTLLGMLVITLSSSASKTADLGEVMVVGFYASAFSVFVTGFTAWIRARTNSPATARLLLLVAFFFISAGPWIVAAMVGALASSHDDALLLAAPSPFYAIHVADLVHKHTTGDSTTLGILASTVSASAWALFGLALLGVASRKCREVIRAYDAAITETNTRLAAEDVALREQEDAAEEFRQAQAQTAGFGAPAPTHAAPESTRFPDGYGVTPASTPFPQISTPLAPPYPATTQAPATPLAPQAPQGPHGTLVPPSPQDAVGGGAYPAGSRGYAIPPVSPGSPGSSGLPGSSGSQGSQGSSGESSMGAPDDPRDAPDGSRDPQAG